MARTYGNTTDKHRFTLVSQMTGAFSIGAWVRRSANGGWDTIYNRSTSASASKLSIQIDEFNFLTMEMTGSAERRFGSTKIETADGWVFVGVDKAAGTTTPRCHVWKQASGWTHANGDGTQGNPETAGASATIRIGEWQGGSADNFSGDIEMVFEVNGTQLTDGEWESAAFSRDGVMAQGPSALWELRQSATSEKVRDITGNGNDQSEVSGTSVTTRSCPFYFAGSPPVYSRQGSGEEETQTFTLTASGTSVSSFTETETFEMTETGEGTSVSSFSGSETLEWIEIQEGTSSSTGSDTSETEEAIFFTIGGTSVSSGEATDSFEATESVSGSSVSSGSESEVVESGEVVSGESTSSGSGTQTLIFVETAEGTSVSSFTAEDEASFTEAIGGTSFSSSEVLDETSATEVGAGSSSSTGSETNSFTSTELEQPTPAPIQHLGRRRPVQWRFILVDSSNMEELGEIKQARGKRLELALDKSGGCSFNVPIDYDLFKDVEEINHGILAYRNKKPRYSGMIWNLDESIDGNSIAVQSVGWFETLNHRILRENVGYPPFSTGVVKAGQIVFMPASGSVGTSSYHPGGLLTIANAQHTTWLTEGTSTDIMQRIISYAKGQNIGQAITQLSEIEAGFDFWIDPVTRVLDITAWNEVPDKTESVVFGFNWGNRNIKQLGRQFDPSVMTNRVTALGKYGGGFAEDVESQNKYQLFEEMPTLNDVVDPNVLLGYAGGEVLLRKQPRVLYSFTPFPYSGSKRVPQPFEDYDIGDIVSFTAVRKPRVDIRGQAVRVFGMNIDITDEGNEKVSSLQISP